MLENQYKNKKDEWYTPREAIYPVLKYLKEGSVIWCPFDKAESNYVKVLSENGFKVIYSHIEDGRDFFEYEPEEHYDYIFSNPPFSLKDQVFKRAFELNKPFMLIMDCTKIFDSKKRWELFTNNDFSLIYLSPRVNYIDPFVGKTSGVPFQSAYVCNGISKNHISFENLKKDASLFD